MMQSGLRLAATGVLLGLTLAWGLARTLEAMLYQTSAYYHRNYVATGIMML